ncbi:hypothetical protein CL6EHI_158290 [Entamoeba histolytica]|uniref:Uncharacterized protein n=7 Tax=Entamoeba histolytica TaxID=5759 RepID=C4M2E8_ENTH1|nr:hypothetical protein EHI_158290 [Entamoeba histolytica HM-1:IMSS]EAL44763.2 hypothetical protein EHI_158290 [Entamoeba histolytica HM-1:IMSS]EMD42612.1 Hypothetical protein EHI5A_084510 [Entamoeba histolytica KU27]ENY59854.1 hypothetical protein EHI7A_054270 [Entamoeba histolytica HM-1:IMSS-A]GAT95450.1 hypothetical protein CL6EHI_158290 [Entamoeba histolytica]|eukprot:XP_650149.2 hypothetical protein EHI_158290 [Entamoeba histolytica HM-1:IMSS]
MLQRIHNTDTILDNCNTVIRLTQEIKNNLNPKQEIHIEIPQSPNNNIYSSKGFETPSTMTYQQDSFQSLIHNRSDTSIQNESKVEDLKTEPVYKLYISIEEAMNGCHKLVPLYDSEGNEEIIIVDLCPGVNDRETFNWGEKTVEVRYIKHPYLSRRGNDLIIDKKALLKGVQHPRSNRTFNEKDEEQLKSLRGFQNGTVIIE